jgi:hypothetical protein
MKWEQWIEDLLQLPANAPEWDPVNIEQFLNAIRHLADAKQRDREAGREAVRLALATLLAECHEQLRYLEITDCPSWSADQLPLSEAGALVDQIEQFHSLINRHQELRNVLCPRTKTERLSWQDALVILEGEIYSMHVVLASALTSLDPSKPPSHPQPTTTQDQECNESVIDDDFFTKSISETTPSILTSEPVSDSCLNNFKDNGSDLETPPNKVDIPIPIRLAERSTPAATLNVTTKVAFHSKDDVVVSINSGTEDDLAKVTVSGPDDPKHVTTLLQQDDKEEIWQGFLWSLIAVDDLAGAYWLTRSLSAQKVSLEISESLWAAAQGARWLASDCDPIAEDMLVFASEFQPLDDDVQALLALASSLSPSLLAPGCGLSAWLCYPECCPALHQLVSAVSEFSKSGLAIPRIRGLDMNGAEGEAGVAEAAAAIKHWLDESLSKRMMGASTVWRHLVGPESDFYKVLLPASENRTEVVSQVRRGLTSWRDRGYVTRQIDEVNNGFFRKIRPIEHSQRNYLAREILEAANLAHRWCDLAQDHRPDIKDTQADDKWQSERVETLRDALSQELPKAEAALARIANSSRVSLAAAAKCLSVALRQLRQTLKLPSEVIEDVPILSTHDRFIEKADNLTHALSRRLLFLADIPLDDNGSPREESLPLIANALRDSYTAKRTEQEAFTYWLARQDFRFVEDLLNLLSNENDVANLSHLYTEALRHSRQALRVEIHETREAIEQAVLDGIIADERAEYSSIVESINPDESFEFPRLGARLHDVRNRLEDARQQRLNSQRERWKKLEQELVSYAGISPVERDQMRVFVQSAVERDDVRVIDECIARVTEMLATEGDTPDKSIDLGWFAPSPKRAVFQEFFGTRDQIGVAERIEEWLDRVAGQFEKLPEAILEGRELFDVSLPNEKEGREELANSINAWLDLKRQGPDSRDIASRSLSNILQYLGFRLTHVGGAPVRIEQTKSAWLHARVSMSAGNLAKPIPHFGSKSDGIYEVVCLWKNPGAKKVGALLHDLQLDTRTVIVFYLGCLSEQHRCEMGAMARERERALITIDEAVLLFLTGEADPRLPVLLQCTLPFSGVIPYNDRLHGDVPEEMFFGRDEMIRELLKPEGSSLVYGGRQLGKSAMLRQIERKNNKPERQEYVWLEDLNQEFGPHVGKTTDNIWQLLRERFKAAKLISSKVATDTPEAVARYIRQALSENPGARILAMFDEADDFLDADAKDNFRVVIGLRSLMLDTQQRFKVVFAGNKKVQRFIHIPNQPLAQYGKPILIGPLEPRPAQQLVREPFEILGYQFADDATVLRIMSYTNYHAGLLQVFCRELLRRLHAQTSGSLPPYTIQQSDVEAVYRDHEVRDTIRERFNLTLALDTDYQVITWAVIEDQMAEHDSYAKSYAASDLLKMARKWWPQGFAEISTDLMLVKLDEMCGLGVLVRDVKGYFHLRSPNLVRLMGTDEDILTRLMELGDRLQEDKNNLDYYHSWLNEVPQRYSPLTYAQEGMLNKPQTGVGLIFASEALGLSCIQEAIKNFIPSVLSENSRADCKEIPSSIVRGSDLRIWLEAYVQEHSKHERLVVYQRANSPSENIRGCVEAALTFCQQVNPQKGWLRIIFVLDPSATWGWLMLPDEIRRDLEERADITTHPRRWTILEVRNRLAQLNMVYSDEVCRQVLQATNGWPLLLDALLMESSKHKRNDDPRSSIPAFEQELSTVDTELRRTFAGAVGIDPEQSPWKVLQFIGKETEVLREWITPTYLGKSLNSADEGAASVEYLHRMGCIDVHDDILKIEPIVQQIFFSQI